MESSTDKEADQTPSANSSPMSWGQWAKMAVSSSKPTQVLAMANLGRGIDVLDRNQRRAERIGDTVLPTKTAAESEGEDDMGVHFGDVQQPQPIVINGNQSGGSDLLKGLAIAALGAAIPGAGLAGYFVSQALTNPKPVVTPDIPNQNDFSVGLGKITDYLKETE